MREAHPRLRNCITSHVFPVRNKEVYVHIILRKEEKYFPVYVCVYGTYRLNLISFDLIKDDLNY